MVRVPLTGVVYVFLRRTYGVQGTTGSLPTEIWAFRSCNRGIYVPGQVMYVWVGKFNGPEEEILGMRVHYSCIVSPESG